MRSYCHLLLRFFMEQSRFSRGSGKTGFLRKFISTFQVIAALAACVSVPAAETFLFDFGADATTTTGGQAPTPIYWNNVPASIGGIDDASLPNLVTTNNTPTDISFQMVSRFNGANENGTTTSNSEYPVSATRDSLFGNTELFSNLENITPIFKLTGLAQGTTYNLTFYASRTGVSDNRE